MYINVSLFKQLNWQLTLLKDFFQSWTVAKCPSKLQIDLNLASHILHWNGVLFWWIDKMCFFKLFFDIEVDLHTSHKWLLWFLSFMNYLNVCLQFKIVYINCCHKYDIYMFFSFMNRRNVFFQWISKERNKNHKLIIQRAFSFHV